MVPGGHLEGRQSGDLEGRNLDGWLRSHAGHIVSRILKETHGFFYKVPAGHLAEYIVKELSMYLLVTCWLNC